MEVLGEYNQVLISEALCGEAIPWFFENGSLEYFLSYTVPRLSFPSTQEFWCINNMYKEVFESVEDIVSRGPSLWEQKRYIHLGTTPPWKATVRLLRKGKEHQVLDLLHVPSRQDFLMVPDSIPIPQEPYGLLYTDVGGSSTESLVSGLQQNNPILSRLGFQYKADEGLDFQLSPLYKAVFEQGEIKILLCGFRFEAHVWHDERGHILEPFIGESTEGIQFMHLLESFSEWDRLPSLSMATQST